MERNAAADGASTDTSVDFDAERSLFQRSADFLFGYDFFISYAWSDARPYAMALADQLAAQGFQCFLDSRDYAKGENWRSAGRRAIRKTSRLIVVVTPGALRSEPVLREVEAFSQTGRFIVPIDVAGRLRDGDLTHPLLLLLPSEILRAEEAQDALGRGPSENVLRDIRDGFRLLRQNQKRVRWLAAAAGILALVAAVAVAAGVVAEIRRKTAVSRALAAQAVLESDRQLDLALLLAAEAHAVKPTSESQSSLLRVLHLAPVDRFQYVEGGPVGRVVAHPGHGSWMAVVDWPGGVAIWDVERNVRRAHAHAGVGKLFALAISEDGRRIAAGGDGHCVIVWELSEDGASLKEIQRLNPPQGKTIRALEFLSGSSLLVSADDAVLAQYDFATEAWSSLPSVHTATVSAITRDPSGRWLVTGSSDRKLVFWDRTEPGWSRREAVSTKDWPLALSVSPDGRWLAVGTHDWDLEIWKVAERTFAFRIPLARSGGRVLATAFSPDNRQVLWGGDDGAINALDLKDGVTRRYPLHRDAVLSFANSSDGRHLLSAGRDEKLAVWDWQQLSPIAREVAQFTNTAGWITATAYSDERGVMLLGDERGNLSSLEVDQGQRSSLVPAHNDRVNSIVAGPAANEWISTGADGQTRWWSLTSLEGAAGPRRKFGPVFQRLFLIPGTESYLGVTAGGDLFRFSKESDGAQALGNVFGGPVDAQPSPVYALHPTRPWLVAGSLTNLVLYDYQSGTCRWRNGVANFVQRVHFAPDGTELMAAVGSAISVWGAENGELRAQLNTTRVLPSIWEVSEEGLLLCADTENQVTWWDLVTRGQLATLKLPTLEMTALSFSPRRKVFYGLERSYSEGWNLYHFRVWQANPSVWAETARQIANRPFSAVEAKQFGISGR